MRFRLIDDDHRIGSVDDDANAGLDGVTESAKWKRKLMGVAPVPEVIRIET